MTIRFFDSPFHVTHDEEIANKMVGEVELLIVTDCPQKPGVEENEAGVRLDVGHSRIPKPQDQ
ncbi:MULTISPECIES: hypothetical protein [Pseudomonas]|uniref:hypothetical protein n=1 Tax=Pseudomonas TaxID=286 RepID=UPI001C82EAAE|nr:MULTISPECIES: hypothetical protein [Pseudomonas]MDI1334345.1 hypothetical protein [Pseudomonas sp.]MDO8707247.1 hypothetical protein [Pseudomonas sp.]QZA98466.1 hypothetical protein K3369_02375 [Pseudomonas mandelii]